MEVFVIIPARGGSKGVPKKNQRLFCGQPLISWSINSALESKRASRVVVSTDCQEIADIALNEGAEVPGLRPDTLAEDTCPTEPVVIDAMQRWCKPSDDDLVVLLQPTSPIRERGLVDKAINHLLYTKSDSLVSVNRDNSFRWIDSESPTPLYDFIRRPRRQDIPASDSTFRENGSIYVTKWSVYLSHGNRLGGKICLFPMRDIEGHEIDTEEDWVLMEALMAGFNQ